jgi:cytochrome c553
MGRRRLHPIRQPPRRARLYPPLERDPKMKDIAPVLWAAWVARCHQELAEREQRRELRARLEQAERNLAHRELQAVRAMRRSRRYMAKRAHLLTASEHEVADLRRRLAVLEANALICLTRPPTRH